MVYQKFIYYEKRTIFEKKHPNSQRTSDIQSVFRLIAKRRDKFIDLNSNIEMRVYTHISVSV